MNPTQETSESLTYVIDGVTYVLSKTDPPVLTVTYDLEQRKGLVTWLAAKAEFDAI